MWHSVSIQGHFTVFQTFFFALFAAIGLKLGLLLCSKELQFQFTLIHDSSIKSMGVLCHAGVHVINIYLLGVKGIVSKLPIKFWMCQKCGKLKNYI
jgi:hypothetical protein